MTNQEALEILDTIPTIGEQVDALEIAINALEQTSHLIDRPCEACDLRKEKGCCKWSCIFENVGESK